MNAKSLFSEFLSLSLLPIFIASIVYIYQFSKPPDDIDDQIINGNIHIPQSYHLHPNFLRFSQEMKKKAVAIQLLEDGVVTDIPIF